MNKSKSRNKKYYLWIFGCQMNRSDGEKIAAVLRSCGFKPAAKAAEAGLMVVVACSVRQTAIDRVYGKARQWQQRRRSGKITTVLTGCVLDPDKSKLSELFDLIIPIKDLKRLPGFLQPRVDSAAVPVSDYLKLPARYESDFMAYVPIMTGCNNYCSYCVVPYVRGREVSRPAKEILADCRQLLKRGYKEITLLGQNVNSYRHGPYNFPKLLREIDNLPGDFWLRFATSHPKDLSDELIGVMSRGKHITPYLHLPIQAGDGKILQAMNRQYTPGQYLKLVSRIRKKVPGLMLSTDVLVGYPGETRSKFENTAKLARRVKFDMIYINKYSPRRGTAAFELDNNVSWPEKKRREKKLNEILKQTALEHNKKLIKKTVRVLVDGWKNGYCFGKTDTFKTAAFAGDKKAIGKFAAVRIIGADSWGLKGELV